MEIQTFTIGQIADSLQVKPLTIRRMWIRKEFPAPLDLGRVLRWRKTDVETWLANRATSDRYQKELSNEDCSGTENETRRSPESSTINS